jgi:hypothetical protein
MDGRTKLEEIADNFVEDFLRNCPVMVYSLHTFIEDWIDDKRKELENKNNLTLEDILRQHRKSRSDDKEIDNELINAAEKVLNPADTEEIPDTTLLAEVESIEDHLLYELTHLVLRSSKVRIRYMDELEESELDPFIPNKWIYHKDAPLEDVLNYIRSENRMFRKEDEFEEQEQLK